MDKQREEFEAWVREYGNYPRRPELKTSNGAYHHLHTESEWRAWQAAQSAQPAHHLPEAGNMVAQPEGWKPSDKPMTNERARYFMERFKNEEKLLGPHEQSAVDYVIAMLQQAQPEPVNQVLLKALSAMLTHSGMDEDEWSKPTFDQARAAIMLATTKTQECGMCGYVGTKTDAAGQCPRCHWDELQAQPERAEDSVNAKRYLWLRDEAYSAGGKTPFIVIGRDDSNCYAVSSTTADEAIDAAIKQGGQHD